jgi:hypothetical protein
MLSDEQIATVRAWQEAFNPGALQHLEVLIGRAEWVPGDNA